MVADPTAPGYSHTTTIIGAVNGVFFGAGFFGTFLSGWLNDRVGRVNSIRIGSTIGIIGGIIQTAAVNQAMVVLHFLSGFFDLLAKLEGVFIS
jgi:MFS family permease